MQQSVEKVLVKSSFTLSCDLVRVTIEPQFLSFVNTEIRASLLSDSES